MSRIAASQRLRLSGTVTTHRRTALIARAAYETNFPLVTLFTLNETILTQRMAGVAFSQLRR